MNRTDRATFPSLRAAIGLITAHIGDVDVVQGDVIGDVPAATVIRTLTLICTSMLRTSGTPAATDAFLRALGIAAADESANRP